MESSLESSKRKGHISEDTSAEKRAKFISDQLDMMSDEQLTRFEFFIRSHFPRNAIKAMLTRSLQGDLTRNDVTDEIGIVVASLAKLFVGELIETATDLLKDDESAPQGLQSDHIREAYRRLCNSAKLDSTSDSFLLNSWDMPLRGELNDDIFGPKASDSEEITESL